MANTNERQSKTQEENNEITSEEVRSLVDRIRPSRYGRIFAPVFPEERRDVCAVRRGIPNEPRCCLDTIYLIWKRSGYLSHEVIIDSNFIASKDQMYPDKVSVDDESITVMVGSGGEYSGKEWVRKIRRSKEAYLGKD